MEPRAIEKYQQMNGSTVFPCGLVVAINHPHLAGSPDGIVKTTNAIILLEVKCPATIEKSGDFSKLPYLDEELKLKTETDYMYQIQLNLFACNLQTAHLFIFTPVKSHLIEVVRDNNLI